MYSWCCKQRELLVVSIEEKMTFIGAGDVTYDKRHFLSLCSVAGLDWILTGCVGVVVL